MKRYPEIKIRNILHLPDTFLSILTGFLVFVFWINLDSSFLVFGKLHGFNPTVYENYTEQLVMAIAKLTTSVMVVPVMEELFWRSFLIRYIIRSDFMKVSVGSFTWPSFFIVSVLFGLEHNLYFAGIIAGITYNLLLYRTKSIMQCIMSHALTNLLLGIYVINTSQWHYW